MSPFLNYDTSHIMIENQQHLDVWLNEPRNPVGSSGDPVTARLLQAVSLSETLPIRYFGGSEPGQERRIKPLEVFERADMMYVEAYCEARNETRCFKICRIEIEGINKLSLYHDKFAKTVIPQVRKSGGGCLVLLAALPLGTVVLKVLARWL